MNLLPVDTQMRMHGATPTGVQERTGEVFTASGYGMVGTGRTPREAQMDLMEKIREQGAH